MLNSLCKFSTLKKNSTNTHLYLRAAPLASGVVESGPVVVCQRSLWVLVGGSPPTKLTQFV